MSGIKHYTFYLLSSSDVNKAMVSVHVDKIINKQTNKQKIIGKVKWYFSVRNNFFQPIWKIRHEYTHGLQRISNVFYFNPQFYCYHWGFCVLKFSQERLSRSWKHHLLDFLQRTRLSASGSLSHRRASIFFPNMAHKIKTASSLRPA